MPAPTPYTMAAYAVITIVPILILIWYWTMYSGIDRGAITGAGASGGA